jgi:leucyl aminopeptidase
VPVTTRIQPASGSAGALADAARDHGADVVALAVRPGDDGPSVDLAGLGPHLPGDGAALASVPGLSGDAGRVTAVPVDLGERTVRLLLTGVGDESPAALRTAGAELTRRAYDGSVLVTAVGAGAGPEGAQAFAEGVLLASYVFTRASEKPETAPPGDVYVFADAGSLDRARVIAEATALARDLTNTPSLEKSPAWMADQAVRVAADYGLSIRVWDTDALRADGYGGILGVGMGSATPPRLVELRYEPADPERHVVLVGKGITYDSGGLSLKPPTSMDTMKTDMAGGAAVIGAMTALAGLGVRARVTGLVPLAENMPSGSALRPGDVITHYGGRTTEVLNTDAEGRLVLADALVRADRDLDADVVVDIATLTGAAKIALGVTTAALYTDDDTLAAAFADAARASGEKVWRMPLTDDYRFVLDSSVADMANVAVSRATGPAGSIEAALFLREFTGGRPWVHLDAAGPARTTATKGELAKGATGWGTRLFLTWLTSA